MSDSLWPHGLKQTRPPCPLPPPRIYPNPCPLSWWCHQPSHHLLSLSPPAFNLSQHQGLFQWVSSLYQVAKVLEFQLQHRPSNEYSGLISFRMDWLDLLAVQGTSRGSNKSTLKEISPIQDFSGRTDAEAEMPILWPPDAKYWLIGKDSDAGKDWRREEKGTTEDEMVDGITNLMDISLSKL